MIDKLRDEINEIDEKMQTLLLERFDVVKKIGAIKRENGLEIHCPKREEELLKKRSAVDAEYKTAVEEFWKKVMQISKELQKRD